jgi:hypothetical protein
MVSTCLILLTLLIFILLGNSFCRLAFLTYGITGYGLDVAVAKDIYRYNLISYTSWDELFKLLIVHLNYAVLIHDNQSIQYNNEIYFVANDNPGRMVEGETFTIGTYNGFSLADFQTICFWELRTISNFLWILCTGTLKDLLWLKCFLFRG